MLGWALQARWLWFKKVDKDKSWVSLEIPVHQHVVALFQIALQTNIGNGSNTLFWKDKWILGCSVSNIAPLVVAAVPSVTRNRRVVAEALPNQLWAQDIQSGLSMVGLFELFQLVNVLEEMTLSEDEDVHAADTAALLE